MPRGGRRTPSRPAPVSGPSALSQRTDGGPSQPVRLAPAEQYGDRTAMRQLQQAAPMAAGGGPPAVDAAGLPQQRPNVGDMGGVFGPTGRPGEPATAGMPFGAGPGPRPSTTVDFVRALYSRFPNSDMRELLEWAEQHG